MERWIVTISGPDGEQEVVYRNFWEAEECCARGLEYWKDLVEKNKVPARSFTIRKYKQVLDGNFSNE